MVINSWEILHQPQQANVAGAPPTAEHKKFANAIDHFKSLYVGEDERFSLQQLSLIVRASNERSQVGEEDVFTESGVQCSRRGAGGGVWC